MQALDLFNWKCFITVARLGTVRAAAVDLGLDPSSVSRRLEALSLRLGVQLFEARGRKLALTPDGRRALRRMMPILSSVETAVEDIQAGRNIESKTMHIVAPSGFSADIVRRAVTRFQQAYTSVKIWLESWQYGSERFEELGHGIDIIITTLARHNSAFSIRRIADHPTVCVASPRFLREHPVLARPEDLPGMPLGANAQFINGQVFTNRRTGEQVVLSPDLRLLSDSSTLLIRWACSSAGILVAIPHTVAAPFIDDGSLSVVIPEWRLVNNSVYAYSLKDDYERSDSLISAFIDCAEEAANLEKTVSDRIFERVLGY